MSNPGEGNGGGVRPGLGPRALAGWVAGPAAFLLIFAAPTSDALGPEGVRTAALGALMAIWWLTEAIPIPATALLPLVLLPLLGVGTIRDASAPYANPIIFLFLGGFLIALGMQRWKLHRRIALAVLSRVGSRPSSLIGGFMVATAFLSMWVSNTATAMMMLPIGLSVLGLLDRGRQPPPGGGDSPPGEPAFAVPLLLGIAYAASIGGLGTIIGTPPNALLVGYMEESLGVRIGFARWLLLGVPIVVVALPIAYLVLTRLVFRVSRSPKAEVATLIEAKRREQGPITGPEKMVAGVFAATALLWIFRPLLQRWIPGLSDAGIAMSGGLALFLLPADVRRGVFVLDWEWARRVPWDVLILFGGGLSLASAIDRTGLNLWLGAHASGLASWPAVLFILLMTTFIILLTELTSNTATAAAFLPILGAVAPAVGLHPLALTVPLALAASCAFMLPVATPPNAIVYGAGRVTVPEMARAGIVLNVAMIAVITVAAVLLVPLVFGI